MDDLSGLDWSKPSGSQAKKPAMNAPSYASYSTMQPTPPPMGSGRNTPMTAQKSSSSPAPNPVPVKAAQDSFSNLMSFGGAKSQQNLSLAERQAQLEIEKRKKEEEKREQTEAQFGNGQFWDTLGSRGTPVGGSGFQPPPPSNGPKPDDDDDLFAAFNKDTKVDKASHYPPPESQRSTPAANLDLSNPGAWNAAGGGQGAGPGDFAANDDDDPFGLNEMKTDRQANTQQTAAVEDDDFMGDLGRPIDEFRKKDQAPRPEPGKPIEDDDSSSSDDVPETISRQPKANKDPFDKAVATLIDYGFSPDDARRGLVESGSGFNAQAAANWLLDEAHRKSKAQAQGRSQSAAAGSSSQPRRDTRSPAQGDAPDFAKSATAVGNSLFKTANSLWKTGQKKMQQAVADLQQPEGDPNQPKWMREAQQGSRSSGARAPDVNATDEALMLEAGGRPKPARNNSRQGADPRQMPPPERRQSPATSTSSRSSPAPRWQQASAPPVMPNSRSRLDRLAADKDDDFFVSSSRRKKPSPSPPSSRPKPEPDLLFNSQAPKPAALPTRPVQKSAPPATNRPSPSPRPSPRPARQVPSIDPGSLQASTRHRLTGTAHFKRGDYAAAHASYSSSLNGVPSTHPLMILLYTNRALTSLKTGEPKQAISDADSAIKIIGPGNGQGESVAVKGENGSEENRDMKDLYGKALSRKAEGLEQLERWADAGATWQLCVEAGVGGANAIKGRQRCQNALAPKPKAAPKPAARPTPRPSAVSSLQPKKDSEAVTRLRQANEAAAKEDDEKFALSEKVDARVAAWRDGKRDNLRALLGSMDNVLWEGSGWKKVGLHELVMANKVKITYMKAIGKTHPDKIPQDASTEVRLIAGLVFSTLNESWDKFKADNGL